MAVVGLDIGTQSSKAVVVRHGVVLGEASAQYSLEQPKPGWAQQSPSLWESALHTVIPEALAKACLKPGDVEGIAVAGQLDGCIAVDSKGRAITPCLVWMDRRATEHVVASGESERQRTGLVFDASHMAAKICWLRSQGLSSTARFHQPTSYVVERLCGAYVYDHALASTTMLYDLATRDYDEELLSAFGVSRDCVPAIGDSEGLAGELSPEGAALSGLMAGTPVAIGTGDDFATLLGAGITRPGPLLCGLGTAEVVGTLSDSPCIDSLALVETHGFLGRYFVQNPGWQSGGALRWIRGVLGVEGDAELDALASSAPPGCDGVTFLPALSGAMAPRWRASARGCFYGLSSHHGAQHMARAVLEGCAFAMRDVRERLVAMGLAEGEIVLQGGGARSALWGQMRADLCQVPLVRQQESSGSAMGASIIAEAVHSGTSLERLCGQNPPSSVAHRPSPELAADYDKAYTRYRELFDTLEPLFTAQA